MVATPTDPTGPSDAAIEPTEGESGQIPPPGVNDTYPKKSKFPILILTGGILVIGCVLVGIAALMIKIRVLGSMSTLTLTPTQSLTPSFTCTITPLPSMTFTPLPSSTFTLTPSFTPSEIPILTASDTPQPIDAFTETFKPAYSKTPTRVKAVCPCSHDLYECKDFSTHSLAQACYDYCVYTGWGDAHNLDKNGDGIVCKGLP